MIEYFCPYCRHLHRGAQHLVACEVKFIKVAPIDMLMEMCRINGVRFQKTSAGITLVMGPPDTEAFYTQFTYLRAGDIEDYLNPPVIGDNWLCNDRTLCDAADNAARLAEEDFKRRE